ncbi:acyl-CoA/acyl-ACP dehydrogenase [Pseudonocardia sp. RS11V-5]|uniref:acyl-CoA dehydrogenase family protein n=1 Tax=Pseudonocardia terrae TaxID=2905831 RepID=UPI001E3B66A7|nr:acyl-CoA dehydrogenase family protein [Pseudonocardia terrae]MCE3552432.1 acyl-CoA/acyl-ACP dehydrogenase [Pseudonocardia terrae]
MIAPLRNPAAEGPVDRARRLAVELLEPHAAEADDPARGVRREHTRALAAAGLLSVRIPEAEGGLGADALGDVEVTEVLAGACAATWFVVNQHRTPQMLARGAVTGLDPAHFTAGDAGPAHRAALSSADEQAGLAIAHLRPPGPPAVRAKPEGAGWRLHGRADWCTGWGLVDHVMIAAAAPGDRYLFTLVPAHDTAALRSGQPLPLAVMGGTRTVALEIDGLAVGPDAVLGLADGPAYRELDAARTANPTAATTGLLRRVLRALSELDRPGVAELAATLAERADHLRAEALALLLEVPARERIPERLALRGELGALTVRAANALVAARSGGAMLRTSPEQRWAREASFHLVQAQTAPVRAAQLAALGRDDRR